MPVFGRIDALGIAWEVYHDEKTLHCVRVERSTTDKVACLPEDVVHGYIALETHMTMRFPSGDPPSYTEGEWIAVAVDKGGHALAVVARMDGKDCVLLYVFGQRFDEVPTANDIGTHSYTDAILVGLTPDMPIRGGDWPIVARSDHWDRAAWPVPVLARIKRTFDPLNLGPSNNGIVTRYSMVTYSDDLQPVSETPCDATIADALPSETLWSESGLAAQLHRLLKVKRKPPVKSLN
jgi:hypothetical protein